MDFGLFGVNLGAPRHALASAVLAERLGFESLWAADHVVVPATFESRYPYGESNEGDADIDFPDSFVWLSHLAAATERIRLGTGVLVLPQRNPLVVAKQAATLDVLSEGRLLLGVGVGWLAEEFSALGVPFEGRGRRLDDYIGALRQLWAKHEVSMHTEFLDMDRLISRPKPVRGTIPIIIGGHTKAAVRRAARLGDGFFPLGIAVDDLPDVLGVLRSEAAAEGRDPDDIEVTVAEFDHDADRISRNVERYAELDIRRVVLPAAGEPELTGLTEKLTDRVGLGRS